MEIHDIIKIILGSTLTTIGTTLLLKGIGFAAKETLKKALPFLIPGGIGVVLGLALTITSAISMYNTYKGYKDTAGNIESEIQQGAENATIDQELEDEYEQAKDDATSGFDKDKQAYEDAKNKYNGNGSNPSTSGSGGNGPTNVGTINPADYTTSNPYLGESNEIPSIDYVAEAIDTALANQDKAQQNFQDTLASIMPNTNQLDNMLQSNLESIKNPFEVTEETGNEKENNEEVEKLIEEMKDKLDFEEDDFDGIEAYEMEVGGVKSYLSVTSNIKVITDLDGYKEFGLNKFTGEKYVKNGQTHYVARAYDIDGNPLDAVIESVQEGYLAFGGKSGSNGFAKLSGSGNETNYCIEGYGAITFGGVEKYSFYIQGNYDDDENLTIEISEKTGSAVSDVYKGTLRTAMETMRAVNNGSYDVQKVEDGIVFEFDQEESKSSVKKETVEENGHKYTYNKNDKITITNENIDLEDVDGVKKDGLLESSTSTTLTIKEALNMGYTMEDLIEQGYKPLEKDGKEFTDETELEDKVKEAKFEITLKGDPQFKDSQVKFYVDGMKVYYTKGNYAEIVRITDEEGNMYNVKSAIENDICTVEVLLKKLEKEFNVTYGIMGQ